MLITNRDWVVSARERDYAVGAFNINNLESLLAGEEIDPRKILGAAKEAVKEAVESKMRLFGSSMRASSYFEF